MTLRRVFSFWFCLLVVFAFAITPVYADTWAYSFSSTSMLPGVNRPLLDSESFASTVGVPSSISSSQSAAWTNCMICSAPPALVLEEKTLLADRNQRNVSQSFRRGFRLPAGAFENPGMHITGAAFNPGTTTAQPEAPAPALSSVAPESSSTVLLVGGAFCIIIGVRGKSKLG